MSNLRGFKQKLSTVSQLWEDQDYDAALADVESMLRTWPGNAHLHTLWASLVQLQEQPKHGLDEAKQALQQAVDLDKGSPAAVFELAHFLDNVDDDPQAAAKVYAQGVATARQLLLDGLIGQAKALRQLGKREEFLRSVVELLHLARFETGSGKSKAEDSDADTVFESLADYIDLIQLKGPHAEQIQDLFTELASSRSA